MYTARRTLVHLPLTPPAFYDLLGFFRFAFNALSCLAPLRLKKKVDNNRFNPGKPVKSFFNLEWIKKELVSNRLIELSPTTTYVLYLYIYVYLCICVYGCFATPAFIFFLFIHTHILIRFSTGGSLYPRIN